MPQSAAQTQISCLSTADFPDPAHSHMHCNQESIGQAADNGALDKDLDSFTKKTPLNEIVPDDTDINTLKPNLNESIAPTSKF